MKYALKRTNRTDLSDDELIIFDVLFDSNVEVNSLIGGEDFNLSFNYYSHNLDIDELKETINKFVNNGLMHLKLLNIKKTKKIITFVGLTPKGGKLWEKERNPNWEKYVTDTSSNQKGFWELTVFSPSLDIAKDFITTSHECKVYNLANKNELLIQEIKDKEIDNNQPIPWKIFDKLYRITCVLSEKKSSEKQPEVTWELYRQKMRWWRTIKGVDDRCYRAIP